jgi:hypothetical protein
MASLSPLDAALSVGQRVGRYFTLVSLIPAIFLVLWTYVLIASGAPGKPAIHNIEVALSHWSVAKVAGIVIISFAVATILHPLQLITTRLLEGYWGTTQLAVAAMSVRIVHHRKQKRGLQEKAADNQETWTEECGKILRGQRGYRPEWEEEDQDKLKGRLENILRSKRGDRLMRYAVTAQEALRRVDIYPSDDRRILPTQLGNALRSFEDSAGRQYGLDAIMISPHLHLVAPDWHRNYLMDAREGMDSTIRICTVGLVATVLTMGFLFVQGLWLLWALLPYAISYLAYRGAVSAAQAYGGVVRTAIDLNRFRIYTELGLDPPRDTVEERENNQRLMDILGGGKANIRYKRRS